MDPTVVLHPEWAILGVADTDMVTVYASAVLSMAELKAHIDDPDFVGYIAVPGTGGVRSMTLRIEIGPRGSDDEPILWAAVGATYAEALRNLFNAWTPPETVRAELAAASPMLDQP
jgi:hypothetical protein